MTNAVASRAPRATPVSTASNVLLSERVRLIKLPLTMAATLRASALRATGRDVIALSIGEPDFDTPAHVIDAAARAARNGFTRYTAPDGAPLIKDAVQEKLARDNGLFYQNNEIHVAAGCKQVIYNAIAATIDPGDEVVIFAPYWVSYCDIVEFCGGIPVVIPTSAQDGFLPSPDALRQAMSPRTKWVFLNSPNNPTGAVYLPELISRLAQVVAEHPNAMLLSDEIYEQMVYDNYTHVPTAIVRPELRDRILTVNGVSKTYAMTGWRIGFGAGPQWLIETMAKVQSQTTGNASTISQAAAAEALTSDQRYVADWRNLMLRRRERALAVLASTPRLRAHKPSGAFYIFLDVSRCIGLCTPENTVVASDTDFADYILEHASVATVAGVAFGMSPYVRISFALDEARVKEACHRLVEACDALVDR